MGINEVDFTIEPYTVGRDDCTVLPRTFKTLAEAKAYLAAQDKGALARGEFYLDGPEEDMAALDTGHLSPPVAPDESSPDFERLSRALDALRRDYYLGET